MVAFHPSECYDAVIVGGGPAGSSAAYLLARQGVKVALLERHSLPRSKTCGGGVVQRAVRLLPVSIQEAVEQQCYRAELHLDGADLHFSARRDEPIVSMTMRDKLDLLLVRGARQSGASIHPQCDVFDVRYRGDRVELATSSGCVLSRFVVACDGAFSRVARAAGWERPPRSIPALEYEVSVADGDLRRFAGVARFDLLAVPFGYAWVFPKRDHLSIGLLTAKPASANLGRCFGQYLRQLEIHDVRKVDRRGFAIPVTPRKGTLVKRRVLLAGDAAGLADPLTGEGITFAIWSGQLAGRALLEGEFQERRVASIYSTCLSREIIPELRLGRFLAKILYRCPRFCRWLFSRYGQRLCEAVTDVFMGEVTYQGIVRDPANYLKLLNSVLRVQQPGEFPPTGAVPRDHRRGRQ